MGLLKVKVVRGVNLAKRDARGSDPYVVIKMGHQVDSLFLSFLMFNFDRVLYTDPKDRFFCVTFHVL